MQDSKRHYGWRPDRGRLAGAEGRRPQGTWAGGCRLTGAGAPHVQAQRRF
jgi:hypothetical protein